jgi:hypothetical protein
MIINIFIFIQKFIHVVIDSPYIKPTFTAFYITYRSDLYFLFYYIECLFNFIIFNFNFDVF